MFTIISVDPGSQSNYSFILNPQKKNIIITLKII